jgi:transcriptional regulator with XRE-family HTH domain
MRAPARVENTFCPNLGGAGQHHGTSPSPAACGGSEAQSTGDGRPKETITRAKAIPMVFSVIPVVAADADDDIERREQLRSFMMRMRARLRPSEVGLPQLGNRKVPGLRREEVAELVGVSDDWYRWFEMGRSVTVSPQFLSRVAKALRLDVFDQVTLYRLSMSGLYSADKRACRLHCGTADQRNLSGGS